MRIETTEAYRDWVDALKDLPGRRACRRASNDWQRAIRTRIAHSPAALLNSRPTAVLATSWSTSSVVMW